MVVYMYDVCARVVCARVWRVTVDMYGMCAHGVCACVACVQAWHIYTYAVCALRCGHMCCAHTSHVCGLRWAVCKETCV